MGEVDLDSTLIRRGREAVTFTDMATFAATLEQRPIAKLLDELPELARLSDTKFSLATQVLRRRFRGETPLEQLRLQQCALDLAASVHDERVAERMKALFAPDIG